MRASRLFRDADEQESKAHPQARVMSERTDQDVAHGDNDQATRHGWNDRTPCRAPVLVGAVSSYRGIAGEAGPTSIVGETRLASLDHLRSCAKKHAEWSRAKAVGIPAQK